jgi:hypothetical protein
MKRRLIACFLFFAATSVAAADTGSLRGKVMSGESPIADATVTAGCVSSPASMSAISGADGSYWLPVLQPGACDITFAKPGYQTLTRTVEIHGAEESRADVSIEVSAEGESVTSTATGHALLERAEATWHVDEETLSLLPSARSLAARLSLAPGAALAEGESAQIEGIDRSVAFGILDAIGPINVLLTGAASSEPSYRDRLSLVSSRGVSRWDATARLTSEHRQGTTEQGVEITGGGIPHEKLQLFGAFRGGTLHDVGGSQWLAVADAAPLPANALRAALIGDDDATQWSLRDAHVFSPVLTALGAVSNGESRRVSLATAYFLDSPAGVHELSAGVDRVSAHERATSVYLDDHWIASDRWSVDGGVRVGDGDVLPRVGAVFDPRGDGSSRIAASYGEYGSGSDATRETALSWGRQLDGGAWIGTTLLRRNHAAGGELDGLILDAAWRYLIFTFGGNATLARRDDDDVCDANAWVIADAPLIEHDVNIALVERVRNQFFATDLALTYSWSHGWFAPMARLELENVFGHDATATSVDARPRAIRLGVGIRFRGE